jgi:hypothetical protein
MTTESPLLTPTDISDHLATAAVTLTALALVADLAVVVILAGLGVHATALASLWGVIGVVVVGAYRVGRARSGGAS